ncbi:MAG: hypothetical protein JW782_07595 [Candidatus Saganbacteria bacterium]|nr:hypothetical protein [Candidatus Saganbacteria bacterium]
MQVFSGSTDLTAHFNAFFTREGVSLNGLFEGEAETEAYTQALTYLQGQLTSAASNPEERAAIVERFTAYRELINGSCEASQDRSHPFINVMQGLYEELTQFVESDAFQNIRPLARRAQLQAALVGLQAEVFSRLHQLGAPRAESISAGLGGAGTSAEVPLQPFEAYTPILQSVNQVIDQIELTDPHCTVDIGDTTAGSGTVFFDPVGGVTEQHGQPFTGTVVNMDFRYGTHERPASAVVDQASDAAPSADTSLDGILEDDGPGLDGLL